MEVPIAITIQDLGCKIPGGCEFSPDVGQVSVALYPVDVGVNLFAKFLIYSKGSLRGARFKVCRH